MADEFMSMSAGLDSPAANWGSITLDQDVATVPRAIDCTTSGNVDIVSAAGATVTITLTAGAPYPCRPVRVNSPSSGSAAAGIIALW